MMRNTTINLPDDLVQHTKAYAARHGTTMTALIRDHLERITGYRVEQSRNDDPLVAFSEGRMSREAAIKAAGVRDYAQLLLSLGERDLPLRRLLSHEVEAMADTLVRLYRQEREP
jgi:plasmid stability protein